MPNMYRLKYYLPVLLGLVDLLKVVVDRLLISLALEGIEVCLPGRCAETLSRQMCTLSANALILKDVQSNFKVKHRFLTLQNFHVCT